MKGGGKQWAYGLPRGQSGHPQLFEGQLLHPTIFRLWMKKSDLQLNESLGLYHEITIK